MPRRALVMCAILTLISAIVADDKPKTDKDEIQGSWQGVKLEANGQTAPANVVEKGKYVFKENKLLIFEGEKNVQECEFTLDQDKDPKTIDLVATDGLGKGKKMLGIYRIKDDVLTLCVGIERPKEFNGTGKAGLLEFKREKTSK